MRKLISAVTSLAMAATMVSVVAPTAASAAETKGFAIRTFAEADSPYAASGSTVKISADDIAKGDVVVPCAVYLNETTPSSQTYSVQLTVKDTNEAASNISFKYYSYKKTYFDDDKSYTINGVKGHTAQPLTFAGKFSTDTSDLDDNGESTYFMAHGEFSPTCVKGQKTANTTNWYMANVWTNGGADYEWIGDKSDSHPMFVFDVTVPQGTPEGNYELVFCDYNTDKTGKSNNPSCVIETKDGRCITEDGSLKLETMTISVGNGPVVTETTTTTTAKTPTPTTTTTTKVVNPDPTGDINFDFGNWTAKPGTKVEVPVKLTANKNPITSMDVVFKQDSPIKMVGIGDTATCLERASIQKSLDLPGLNFQCLDDNGDGVVAKDGGTVFTLTYEVPANCPAGDYKIGFGDKAEVFKNNTAWTYDVSTTNGIIHVDPGTTTTTTGNTPQPTTTTTTKVVTPDPTGDIIFDFGNWTGEAGSTVEVPVKLTANKNPITSMDVVFAQDSPIKMVGIGDTATCLERASIQKSLDLPGLNFQCLDDNGDGVVAKDGGTVFTLTYEIPANCPAGDYKIGFGDKAEVFKNNTAWTYSVGVKNGVITVGGTTTTTTAPIVTTTTTTTTQDTPTTTTTTPNPGTKLVPAWGDANCDGSVNVADVVVLNRQLNGTLDLTAQGKVNADVVEAQGADGVAVDPEGVTLNMDDSDAIIKFCVHLITKLPVSTK